MALTSERAREISALRRSHRGGRPRDPTLTALMDDELTVGDALRILAAAARAGDLKALQLWLAYRCGKPTTPITVEPVAPDLRQLTDDELTLIAATAAPAASGPPALPPP